MIIQKIISLLISPVFLIRIVFNSILSFRCILLKSSLITVCNYCHQQAFPCRNLLLLKKANIGNFADLKALENTIITSSAYAVILKGVTLGKGCIIGVNSTITKSIPSGYIVAGNPCNS